MGLFPSIYMITMYRVYQLVQDFTLFIGVNTNPMLSLVSGVGLYYV